MARLHRQALPRRHKQQRKPRVPLFLSALLVTAAATPSTAADALPRSAVIQDGLTHKPASTCPASQENQPWYTFPWTHTPTCVDVVFADDPEDGSAGLETAQTLCAYSNARYNNGRGVSFVATPDVAASVTMEAFGMAIGGLDGTVGREMGMWEVRDAGEKGKGMFVKGDIGLVFAGESVVLHTPVLLVSRALLDAKRTLATSRVLRSAVEQLPAATRDAVLELSGGPELEQLVATNAVAVKWPWVDEVPELFSVVPEVAVRLHRLFS